MRRAPGLAELTGERLDPAALQSLVVLGRRPLTGAKRDAQELAALGRPALGEQRPGDLRVGAAGLAPEQHAGLVAAHAGGDDRDVARRRAGELEVLAVEVEVQVLAGDRQR